MSRSDDENPAHAHLSLPFFRRLRDAGFRARACARERKHRGLSFRAGFAGGRVRSATDGHEEHLPVLQIALLHGSD